jgi:thiosulfate dehydrogenase [quinone] large subunit
MSGYRQAAVGIAAVAVLLLIWLTNPWFKLEGDLRGIVTIVFWILAIALVVVLFLSRKETGPMEVSVSGPAVTQFLFHDARAGLIWLPIRIFLGFSWIDASLHKITGHGWLDNGGASLLGYWQHAIAIPDQGSPPIAFEWYRDFINALINADAQTWFAPLIAFGEMAVGLGLLFGALTGVAAFFGALMNMSFLLAGSASSNPVLFTLAIGIILAWRVAGYYGIDRWLLPAVGTPWERGPALGGETPAPTTT